MKAKTFHSAHPLVAAFLTSAIAALCGLLLPEQWASTAIGLLFLLGAYLLVGHQTDSNLREHGLALGGLLSPEPLRARRIGRDLVRSFGVATAAALIVLPPFYFGYLLWYAPESSFEFGRLLSPRAGTLPEWWPWDEVSARWWTLLDLSLGHLLVVALPEEAFFRGYLQTRLDQRYGTPVRLLGAPLGWGLILSSAVFAIGHVLTVPHAQRLAVFFPSLLFGWLRSRTGGIGASVFLHAYSNLCVEMLNRGYGAN